MNNKNLAFYTFMWILAVLAVSLWSYIIGVLTVSIQHVDPLKDTYESYNHIQIYEDGSYVGQTKGGMNVTGCIEKAICND